MKDLWDDFKYACVWTGTLMGFSILFCLAIEAAYK